MEEIRFNLTAPNLLCICVDDRQHGESSGRVYGCYSREGVHFTQEYQLVKIIENVMDSIDYPQSSVKIRSFQETESKRPVSKPEKVLEGTEVAAQRGRLGTFLIHVKYRQNATWQGDLLWMEKQKKSSFRSELELFKQMDQALEIQRYDKR